MKVKIKRLHHSAIMPYKTYRDDYCYDCVATSRTEVAPNVYRYGLGFALQIERTELERANGLTYSIDFRPRSSVWKTGMVLSNCTGTVDESYTGEICAVFYHVMPGMPVYEVGDRIGQIKLGISVPMEFVETEELQPTLRGDGGYGSTGK